MDKKKIWGLGIVIVLAGDLFYKIGLEYFGLLFIILGAIPALTIFLDKDIDVEERKLREINIK